MSLQDDGTALEAQVTAFVVEATSQVATEDPTWAAVQAALVAGGWTAPVSAPSDTPTPDDVASEDDTSTPN